MIESVSQASQSPALQARNVQGGHFSTLDQHPTKSRGVSRTGSVKSMARYAQQNAHRTAAPLGFATLDKPVNDAEVQDPGMGEFDTTTSVGPEEPHAGGYVNRMFPPSVVLSCG